MYKIYLTFRLSGITIIGTQFYRRNGVKKIIFTVVLAGVVLALTGCGKKTVAQGASKHKLDVGTAFASDIFDPEGQKRIKDFSNLIVAENSMKWANLRPNAKFWNWSDIDNAMKFAEENRISVKWHTLFWHQQNSGFLSNMKTEADAIKMMDEHIETIMQRYKGRIKYYDVVNEMFNEDGTFRKSIWYNILGESYIEHALTVARAVDPDTKLYLNEFNNEAVGHPKADAMYEYVKRLKENGVPVDGVGMQLHLATDLPFDADAIRANVRRYAEIGVDISFSEIDVRLPESKFNDPAEIQKQSDIYTALMEIALTEPNVKSYIVWGLYDKTNWVPATFPSYGNACLYDKNYNQKPVYKALEKMLK